MVATNDKLVLLLAAMFNKNEKLSIDFKYMSRLSESLTDSALEHQFRGPKKLAKELVEQHRASSSDDAENTPKQKGGSKRKRFQAPEPESDKEGKITNKSAKRSKNPKTTKETNAETDSEADLFADYGDEDDAPVA